MPVKHIKLYLLVTLLALLTGHFSAQAQATFPVEVTFQGLMNNGKYAYVITSGLHNPYNSGEQKLTYSDVRFYEQAFDIGSAEVPITMTVRGDFTFPTTSGDATVSSMNADLVFTSGSKYITAVSVSTYDGTPVSVESITGTYFERDVFMQQNTTFGKVTLTMATHTPLDYAATIGGIEATYLDDGVNQPVPTVTYKETSSSTPVTLTPGTDYTVSYTVGSTGGTVTITGMGDYVGSKSKSYAIRQLQLSDFHQLGDGSYEIAAKQDLDNLAKFVGNGNNCEGATFRQTNDIAYSYQYAWDNINNYSGVLTENNYTAIGGYGQPFNGTYDGQGHSISGIRIKKEYGRDGDYAGSQGLFGFLGDNGTVQNVIVKDAMIDGYINVGGIVGYNSGTVSNCIAYHVRLIQRSNMNDVTTSRGPITGHNGGTVTSCYYRHYIAVKQNGHDQLENNRYDNVYTVTTASGVTATLATGASAVFDDVTCYTAGSTVTLSYSGEVPEGYEVVYNSTGGTISGNTLTIPGADVTVIADVVPIVLAINGRLIDGFYWATYYNGSPRYTLSEGATAYTMGTDYKLYRLGTDGRTIPANTAVVIIADRANIALTLDSRTTVINDHAPGGNQLQGSDSPVTVSGLGGTPHVLSLDGTTIGFHPYTGTEIPANKAYYVTYVTL